MEAALLALLSAIFFGLNALMVRIGLHHSPYRLNAVYAFFTAAIVLWVTVIFSGVSLPPPESLGLFVIAGILAPGLSAFFGFESFRRIGIATTTSLFATAPLFGAVFAIFFLGEILTLATGIGTVLVALGIFFLSYFRSKEHIHLRDLPLPLIAAFLISIGAVVSKAALQHSPTPISGLAVALTAGACVHLLALTVLNRWGRLSNRLSVVKYFIFSGVFIAGALGLFFLALNQGDLTVVFPINQTQALFAILFSWLFLREQDFITRYTLVGAVAIVLGSVLITVA